MTQDSSVDAGRRYGGADADERRTRRRAALIAAGLEVFGADGYAQASVKKICAEAGLTQRYFYESFTDRAGLLIAVYDDCVQFVRAATVAAAVPFVADGGVVATEDVMPAARAILGAFMACLTDDPLRARVMLVEVVGVSPEIERIRLDAIHGWADLILLFARGSEPSTRAQRLAAIALVGAVTQLLVDWYTTTHGHSPAEENPAGESAVDSPAFDPGAVLDVCVDLFGAAHERLLT